MMIKAIFFDYGGTLFDYDPTNFQVVASIARKYGRAISERDPLLSKAFQRQEEHILSLFRARGEPPELLLSIEDWKACDQVVLDVLGITPLNALDDLYTAFLDRGFSLQIYQESKDTIQTLKNEGYTLGIISNLTGCSRIAKRYSQMDQHGLLDLFDVITLSGEVGVSKPHPEIFLRSIERLGAIKAEETMMVGDSYIFDILGARNVGMVPVFLDPNMGTDYSCQKISAVSDIHAILDTLKE